MKMSLLTMVQKILSDMDAEPVNSVGDTLEAGQVASILGDTFYNIVHNKKIPEFEHFIKLTALSDSEAPTHFQYPTAVDKVYDIWYDVSDDGTFQYKRIKFLEPSEFIKRIDAFTSDYTLVDDRKGGTKLRIKNNSQPTYYTSFDDDYIVMDSYDSSIDNTLQASKSRAFVVKVPVFSEVDDTYVPELDDNLFPLFYNEAKSVCFSLLKGGPDPKIDQAARRQRYNVQNDLYKTKRPVTISGFGR